MAAISWRCLPNWNVYETWHLKCCYIFNSHYSHRTCNLSTCLPPTRITQVIWSHLLCFSASSKVWVHFFSRSTLCFFPSAGGRLQRELKYTEDVRGEGSGVTFEMIIQTPRTGHNNLLSVESLLLHYDALKAATKITVDMFGMWVVRLSSYFTSIIRKWLPGSCDRSNTSALCCMSWSAWAI